MVTSTLTIRTESELKNQAAELFASMGMNLSTAINIFLRQAVLHKRYPCSIDINTAEILPDAASTYPPHFFSLFGTGNDLGLDEEPEDLPPDMEDITL